MTTETFNSATTWTCPAGVTSVDVECWGGGAGGTNGGAYGGGGGGGGGAYSKSVGVAVVPGNAYTIGGITGGAPGPSASAGLDTYFNTSGAVMAKGGSAGSSATGGTGGLSSGGVGGTKLSGGTGGNGINGTFPDLGGGGGGSSAGTSLAGVNGSNAGSNSGGNGGTAPAGGGSGTKGGTYNTGVAVITGGTPGGGAGGGAVSGPFAGGTGGAGRVVLTYTATFPTLSVTGTADNGTYAYGNVPTNEATSHQFIITNTGDGSDTLGTLTISGDGWSIDAADDPSGDALAASGTTTVTVIGNFTTAGEKSGILTIPSNDANSPYVINLTAVALAPSGPHLGTMGLLGVGK